MRPRVAEREPCAEREDHEEGEGQGEPPPAPDPVVLLLGVKVEDAEEEEDPVVKEQVREREPARRRVRAEASDLAAAHHELRDERQGQEPEVTQRRVDEHPREALQADDVREEGIPSEDHHEEAQEPEEPHVVEDVHGEQAPDPAIEVAAAVSPLGSASLQRSDDRGAILLELFEVQLELHDPCEEHGHTLELLPRGADRVERSQAAVVRDVRVCPLFEEQLDHLRLTQERGPVERGGSIFVSDVPIRARLEQGLHDLVVTVDSGPVQRGALVPHPLFGVGALF